MKNILKTAKSVLIPLWLTAAAATNAAVQNTFVGSTARPLDLKKCDLKNVWYKKNGWLWYETVKVSWRIWFINKAYQWNIWNEAKKIKEKVRLGAYQHFWYFQNKPKFKGVCSGNNLPKTKDEVFLINIDENKSVGTHWIVCM